MANDVSFTGVHCLLRTARLIDVNTFLQAAYLQDVNMALIAGGNTEQWNAKIPDVHLFIRIETSGKRTAR